MLSTLPPSMALDVMMRMRETQQAANREMLEERSGKPASFSQFQMQQYLAAVGFRCVFGTGACTKRCSAPPPWARPCCPLPMQRASPPTPLRIPAPLCAGARWTR